MNKDTSDEPGVPVNVTTILALLTLLGGVLLVTHKLSSDRPVVPSGEANQELSEEKVDTRLWEDPFGRSSQLEQSNKLLIGNLAGDIEDKRNKDFRLLAVMIPGGPASEDRELRIRSRFAIVSALAESAYAPRQAAQIGIGAMPWPTTLEISTNIADTNEKTNNTEMDNCIRQSFAHQGFSNRMFFAFEWYEREPFLQYRAVRGTNREPVLVVWLDEDQFNDYPIPRLDLFFRNLGDRHQLDTNETWLTGNMTTNSTTLPTNHHYLALIGPGHSDTLKAIFARDFDTNGPPPGNNRTNWTKKISLFLAAPRAIDQVLVTNHYDASAPRQALVLRLKDLFYDAQNLAPSDSDLAWGVLEELESRGVDLSKTNECHLVLIGGWDEYFGRMLSAAYTGELAAWPSQPNRGKFFEDYRGGDYPVPTNLHTFLYLSGLDGQGLSSEAKGNGGQERERASAPGEDSAKDSPTRWTPDENRAEGPAQYDYLGRLAGRIQQLNDQLLREGRGTVSAIGIGGGDVYDTLLILQALRPRFPDAIFFTTELDARFWDPKEWQWSRNLVVVSGYGLRLSEDYQLQTAPFRDSQQTALFAAALAALGSTNVPNLTNNFPIRRFEIGRNGPVTLTTNGDNFQPHLHPEPNQWPELRSWFTEESRWLAAPGILLCGLLLAVSLSRHCQQFSVCRHQSLAEPLWLREEDIGGLDGFIAIARRLGRLPDKADSSANEQKVWLRNTIEAVIMDAEDKMDRDLEEPCAASIFAEADILKPDDLVMALQGEEGIAEPEGFTDSLRAERKRLAIAMREELPAGMKVLLTRWHSNRGDTSVPLEELIRALRAVINTVDLSNWAAQPDSTNRASAAPQQAQRRSVLWRKNRELLREPFGGVLRPPVSLGTLFFTVSEKEARSWQKELKEALKEPERRECLQLAMLQVLDAWNAHWPKGFKDAPGNSPCAVKESAGNYPRQNIPPVQTGAELDRLKTYRDDADKLIDSLLHEGEAGKCPCEQGESQETFSFEMAADAARAASRDLYSLCCLRWHWLVAIAVAAMVLGAWMFNVNLRDTASWPWEISGASLWPSNWLYLLAVMLGFLFISESYFQLRTTMLETTRQCRLDYRQTWTHKVPGGRIQWRVLSRVWGGMRRMFHPSSREPVAVVCADQAWGDYQLQGRGLYRSCRTFFFALAYFLLILGIYQLALGHRYSPFLRDPARHWYTYLVWIAFSLFLFLSFWTIDAAFLCRWFILRISQGPTLYSLATRQHFSRQRGQVPYHVLSEWIDVSVIAHIAERVGMLIYFPAVLFLLIILANNSLFYYFPWPPTYYVLATCNLAVAAASIVILQQAARKARDQSLQVLQEKLNQLKAGAAISEAQKKQHDIKETEELLDEIRSLRKGAFGGFWGNPVVGALLVPSSGTALIEILRYLIK
jgi:hypothetical protein